MTVSPKDINTISSRPIPETPPTQVSSLNEPGTPPEPPPHREPHDQAERTPEIGGATQMPRHEVLALMHQAGNTPAQIQEVRALLPEQVDSQEHHLVLEKYGLNTAARRERHGSSP